MSLPSSELRRNALNTSSVPALRLYNMRYCHYCSIVREAAERLELKLDLIDVLTDQGARQKLKHSLGRSTVPVLSVLGDEGELLIPESRDIIRYLESLRRHVDAGTSTTIRVD